MTETGKKAKELASKYARQYHHNSYPEQSSNGEFVFSNEEIENACNKMAEWKEEQMIQKAVEWLYDNIIGMLDNNVPYVQSTYDVSKNEFIKDFKQAMKGE